MSRLLYELTWQAVRGGIKRESFFASIGGILVSFFTSVAKPLTKILPFFVQVSHADVASLLLDVLNVIDHETLVNGNNDERQKLCSILKELENWLGDALIKERLEIDTLQDASLLKTKKIFYTRFIKVKTKLFYKQQKFNLLREESEGYAKLITELNQPLDESVTPSYLLQVKHWYGKVV